MDEFYVYIYYDPSRNNEPIYVGKGSGERAWRHLRRKNMHPFTQRLQFMKKNNIRPIIGLYAGLDEEFSYFLEEELIKYFGRKDLGKGTLLNLTDGGDGAYGTSYRITEEHRKKINVGLRGLKKTEEHRRKIGEAGRGRIPWNKDTKGVMVAWNKGLKLPSQSIESNKKRSISLLGKSHNKICCNNCGKLVGIRSVNRYHNDNCKLPTDHYLHDLQPLLKVPKHFQD
jgi:hypothetical protein